MVFLPDNVQLGDHQSPEETLIVVGCPVREPESEADKEAHDEQAVVHPIVSKLQDDGYSSTNQPDAELFVLQATLADLERRLVQLVHVGPENFVAAVAFVFFHRIG